MCQIKELWLAATVGTALSTACCDREGCDALISGSARSGTGIAGLVAEPSDVKHDGCVECPLGDATLTIWRVDTAVTDDATAATIVNERDPDVIVDVSEHYGRDLEAGSYLLCEDAACIGIDVLAGQRLTVNIEHNFWSTNFYVGTGVSAELVDALNASH